MLFSLALYGYAAKKKTVEAHAEGRICEFGQTCGPAIPAGAAEAPFYTDKQNLTCSITSTAPANGTTCTAKPAGRGGRRDILANMELAMGPLPRINHKLPLRGRGAERGAHSEVHLEAHHVPCGAGRSRAGVPVHAKPPACGS